MTTERTTQSVPDGLLTTADVAQVFRATESTVRYWRQQGVGPRSFKAGRRVLYDSADVREYLEHLRETGTRSASVG
jgi:DNA-binding transcriptional MerR regulator